MWGEIWNRKVAFQRPVPVFCIEAEVAANAYHMCSGILDDQCIAAVAITGAEALSDHPRRIRCRGNSARGCGHRLRLTVRGYSLGTDLRLWRRDGHCHTQPR